MTIVWYVLHSNHTNTTFSQIMFDFSSVVIRIKEEDIYFFYNVLTMNVKISGVYRNFKQGRG